MKSLSNSWAGSSLDIPIIAGRFLNSGIAADAASE